MMNAVLLVLELFTVFTQYAVCSKLCRKRKRTKYFGAAVWAAFFVFFNVLSYLDVIPGFLKALVFIVLFLLVLELVYQDNHKKKVLLTLFMYILGMGAEFIVYQGSGLFGIDRRTLVVSGSRRLLCTILSKLVWFMVIWLVTLFWNEHWDENARPADWTSALLVPVSSMFIVASFVDVGSFGGDWMKFLAVCLILLINLVVFRLYDRLQEKAMNRAEREWIKKQSQHYARLNDELGKYCSEMRNFKHDLKQRYLLEQSYLQQGRYEQLAQCYAEGINMLKNGRLTANTGNSCIDNIINYKAVIAEQKGIEVGTDLTIACDAALNAPDIYSLLGNLLDNAIEAAERTEEGTRWLKVKIRADDSNMLIVMENPYRGYLQREKGRYISTKEDGQRHGVGLKIVEDIAAKYQGEVQIQDAEQIFVVKILLYDVYC